MVFDLYLCMCYSNHNINITKRFYGHENIVLEYYLVTVDKNSNFQDCMRIAALRKQLFARKAETNWDTPSKPFPTPTNARMLPRLKWSGRSVSISEAKISVSEVHVHAPVRKVVKKVGCPRIFFEVFFGGLFTPYWSRITAWELIANLCTDLHDMITMDPNYKCNNIFYFEWFLTDF